MQAEGPFIARFRFLHARRKDQQLTDVERDEYETARRELTHLMLLAQRLSVRAGETPRRALRTGHAVRVEIDDGAKQHASTTLDVAARGFLARLRRAPEVGASVRFVLHFPEGAVSGTARVASSRPSGEDERVGFRFDAFAEDGREVLDAALVDFVLKVLA